MLARPSLSRMAEDQTEEAVEEKDEIENHKKKRRQSTKYGISDQEVDLLSEDNEKVSFYF